MIGKLNIHEKMKLLKREHAPQLMEIEKDDKNFDDNICMMCHMPLDDEYFIPSVEDSNVDGNETIHICFHKYHEKCLKKLKKCSICG